MRPKKNYQCFLGRIYIYPKMDSYLCSQRCVQKLQQKSTILLCHSNNTFQREQEFLLYFMYFWFVRLRNQFRNFALRLFVWYLNIIAFCPVQINNFGHYYPHNTYCKRNALFKKSWHFAQLPCGIYVFKRQSLTIINQTLPIPSLDLRRIDVTEFTPLLEVKLV